MTWATVKKKTTLTKEKHSKEQSQQAEKVKRDSKEFEFRTEEFFAYFKKTMPYEYSTDDELAYAHMDRIHHGAKNDGNPVGSLVDIKRDAIRLNEMQELFELFVIEYRQIDQCEKEAKFLKEVHYLPPTHSLPPCIPASAALASFFRMDPISTSYGCGAPALKPEPLLQVWDMISMVNLCLSLLFDLFIDLR